MNSLRINGLWRFGDNPLVTVFLVIIHDDIILMQFVIPGLTRNPGLFWIPAFAGMTRSDLISVAMYKLQKKE